MIYFGVELGRGVAVGPGVSDGLGVTLGLGETVGVGVDLGFAMVNVKVPAGVMLLSLKSVSVTSEARGGTTVERSVYVPTGASLAIDIVTSVT